MLYKSGGNIEDGTLTFINDNQSVTLFSAYLKLEALKKINESKKIKRIIVRWEVKDLCLGVSDFEELYRYCCENSIALYRNTRIHLKAFWNNETKVLFGSANVTNKGILSKGSYYNYELNGVNDHMSFEDVCYLNYIISKSQYVTESLFNDIREKIERITPPKLDFDNVSSERREADMFLISELPMFEDLDRIYEAYLHPNELSMFDQSCLAHDIAIFSIPDNLNSRDAFFRFLKKSFNEHEFIVKFKTAVINHTDERRPSRNGSMHFGGVKNWFRNNTTTVPTPRGHELTDFISVLYKWIEKFDDSFTYSIEGQYSEILRHNT